MKPLFKINLPFFFVAVVLPAGLVVGGIALLCLFVIFPFFDVQLGALMESPLVPADVRSETGFGQFSFSELGKQASESFSVKSVPATFSLTVPKLRIKYAKVKTNSTELSPDKYLGHYRGTALPGETGNALIYGHSVLPIFYNPKDYKTVFSTLSSLSKGDEFYIDFGGESLTYRVLGKVTLKPEEVDVFDSDPAGIGGGYSTVTLMTCVPPGAKTYRLMVIGQLVKSL